MPAPWRPTGAHADDGLIVGTAINGYADAVVMFNFSLDDIEPA
jgi:hypothetical protein